MGSWAPWFSAGLSRSTLQAQSGTASGRVDITAPYGWGLQLNNWPGFAATPGSKTIGFSGQLGAGTNLGVTMTVRWRNDAGTDLQVDRVSIPTLTTTWQQATAQATAPTGTTRVSAELTNNSGSPGDHLYVDDLRVVTNTS